MQNPNYNQNDRLETDIRLKSETVIFIKLVSDANNLPEISSTLAQIQQQLNESALYESTFNKLAPEMSSRWIFIEEPIKVARSSSLRLLPLGLFGGLLVGAGSGLIAIDSNRVLQVGIAAPLGPFIAVCLPAGSWSSRTGACWTVGHPTGSCSVAGIEVGRQHQAVAPLTQLLQQEGADLRCTPNLCCQRCCVWIPATSQSDCYWWWKLVPTLRALEDTGC